MIKPDWEVFKAKFSENPQDNFEWLCYLLFCNEHGKKFGIFRYKNQSAIETEPIEVEGEFISWQARFYEVPLYERKDKILQMIQKAKRDYPNLNRIYFYTNAEWGQNKGKEPEGKKEIEREAENLSIKIDWRSKSYFESEFVTINNQNISSHFFLLGDSTYTKLKSLENHTKAIISDIETTIHFHGQQFTIDRSDVLSTIKAAHHRAVVITGDGGTGKTALIKSLYDSKKPDCAFYIHKATEFSISRLSDLLLGTTIGDFIAAHSGVDEKIVVIDSAENLLGISNLSPFTEYMSEMLKHGWKILLTTRTNYLNDLSFQLLEIYKQVYITIGLAAISSELLNALAIKYNFQLPPDKRLRDLISIPFYLVLGRKGEVFFRFPRNFPKLVSIFFWEDSSKRLQFGYI